MDSEFEMWFERLEKRVAVLERSFVVEDKRGDTLELNLTLPEADILGLHFNEQKVHAVFDLKKDGKYYSRDILFNSARDTDKKTGRDLLSEYLDSGEVRKAFYSALIDADMGSFSRDEVHDSLKVFLPEENQGKKNYNGVFWWYWLRYRSASSSAYFAYVHSSGAAGNLAASSVGGCAPAFCVAK